MRARLFLLIALGVLSTLFLQAQPTRITKEQLGEKGNALLNEGKQREALALVEAYPEFENETAVWYIKSVAYGELREYKNAEIYFKKQFDDFVNNGESAYRDASKLLTDNTPSKENNSLAMLMFSASLISYGSADMVNSLRAAVFDRNGMPTAVRKPKNIEGYDEMVTGYKDTLIEAGSLQLQTGSLKEALLNLNKAVSLDPKDAKAYSTRAKVYRRLKKIPLARADELKARKLSGQ